MIFLSAIGRIITTLLVVALITYVERKVLASLQLRRGPSVVGPCGILQPIADCIKLLCKQILWPKDTNQYVFCIPPLISIFCTLVCFLFVPLPFSDSIIRCDYSIIIVLCISSFATFGEILPGLISSSKYQSYGARRAIEQVMSYELCLLMSAINIGIYADGFDFKSVIKNQETVWHIIPLIHIFVIYTIASFASANRTPFDTLEAEQELIAGYHTEYSSSLFCVFYINEYANILLVSILISVFFLGGVSDFSSLFQNLIFIMKIFLVALFIIITRGVLPRYRFNDIMKLFWGVLFPVLFVSSIFLILMGNL